MRELGRGAILPELLAIENPFPTHRKIKRLSETVPSQWLPNSGDDATKNGQQRTQTTDMVTAATTENATRNTYHALL